MPNFIDLVDLFIGGRSGLYIENKGTGTAIISTAKIELSGRTYSLADMRWTSVFADLGLDPLCFSTSALKQGAAISAGSEVTLLTKTKSERRLCEIEVAKFLLNKDLKITLSYAGLDNSKYEYRHNFGIQ